MLRFLPPFLSALFLAVLFGAASMGLGVVPVAAWNSGEAQAVATEAQRASVESTKRRCAHCGWIEAMREILPEAADPRAPVVIEYTVRRNDGSSSAFRQALPGSWRLGQRLVLIDGADPLATLAVAGANGPQDLHLSRISPNSPRMPTTMR